MFSEKPDMSNTNDSYWESVRDIYIDNKKIEICVDTTWDSYGYFEFKEYWYKISTDDWEDLSDNEEFSFLLDF